MLIPRKTRILLCTCLIVASMNVAYAQEISQESRADSQVNEVRYGVEGYLYDLEMDPQRRLDDAQEGKYGSETREQATNTGSSHETTNSEQSNSRAAGDCSWTRLGTDGTSAWYTGWIPAIKIHVKLRIKSLTYKGGQYDPDSCWRQWYYSKYIKHNGTVVNDSWGSMVSGNAYRANEAYLSSYHHRRLYGNLAVEPYRRDTYHEAKLQNNVIIHATTLGWF